MKTTLTGIEPIPVEYILRIAQSKETGNLTLLITDYAADDDEAADLRGIWDDNLERLHRVSGL